MKSNQLLLLLLFFVSISFAQIKDIGGIDYTGFNGKDSDPDFSRYRIWLNYPIKLKKKDHVLVNGLRYSKIDLNFSRDYDFDTTPLADLFVLEYTFGYTFLINEKWRFTAQISPTISSNLSSTITANDLTWSSGVLFIRTLKEEKESRLTLGLVYNQRIGIPAPLPFATYYRKVNDHFTYTFGVPISKIKYYINKKTSLESFVTLDGYYANLSDNLELSNDIAEKISMSAIIGGIGFDKYFGKRLNLFAKGGYTLRNSIKLVKNTNDKVFDFDIAKSFTFRAGLKFNF